MSALAPSKSCRANLTEVGLLLACYNHRLSSLTPVLPASNIVDRIIVGQTDWSELLAPHEFFGSYKYYLQICASSSSAEDQLKWQGTVESKIRQLVMKLETVDTIVIAHPFVKSFEKIYRCIYDEECKALAKGEVLSDAAKRTEEQVAGDPDLQVAYCTYWYIGLKIDLKPRSACPLVSSDAASTTLRVLSTHRCHRWTC